MNLKEKAGCLGIATAGYLTLVAAANAIAIPVNAGIGGVERLLGRTEQSELVEVIERGRTHPSPNGGGVEYIKAVTADRDTIQAFDRADVLAGKYFANTMTDDLEVGEEYRLTFSNSPFGYNLLEAEEFENDPGQL